MLNEICKRIIELNPNFSNIHQANTQLQGILGEMLNVSKKIEENKGLINSKQKELQDTSFFQFRKKRQLQDEISKLQIELTSKQERNDSLEQARNEVLSEINLGESKINEISTLYEICNHGNKDLGAEEIRVLINYFSNDFKKFCDFCQQNNIILDFSKEDTFLKMFGDTMVEQKKDEMKKNPKEDERINSLEDGLFLVRKMTDVYPENDVLQCATRGQKRKTSIEYGGEKIEADDAPGSHTTTHWTINWEVQPHKDSGREAWQNCNVAIIQPLTEKIYNQLSVISPVDTMGVGDIKLENYYIICESQEIAQKISQDNPTATPIVFPPDKMNNNVHLFFNLLGGVTTSFKIYDNSYMDGTVPISNYYTEDFLSKYPKFSGGEIVFSAEHRLRNDVIDVDTFNRYIERINSKINGGNREDYLKSIDSFMQNLPTNDVLGAALELDRDFSFSTVAAEKLQIDAQIIDEIRNFLPNFTETDNVNSLRKKLKKEDVDTIFSYIIDGCEISKENVEKYKKLKMYFITDVFDTMSTRQLASYMYKYKKIAQSKVMDLELDDKIKIEIPEEFIDYTDYFTYKDENYQGQGTIEELIQSRVASWEAENEGQTATLPVSLTPTKEGNNKSNLIKTAGKTDIYEFIEEYIKDLDISEDEKQTYEGALYGAYTRGDLQFARMLEVKNIYMRTKSKTGQTFTLEGMRKQAETAREGIVDGMIDQTQKITTRDNGKEDNENEMEQE